MSLSLIHIYGSFNAIAQNLNVQRLYEKAFDQVLISPTPLWQFIAGQIIGGSLRGFYAGGVILVLTMPIDTGPVSYTHLDQSKCSFINVCHGVYRLSFYLFIRVCFLLTYLFDMFSMLFLFTRNVNRFLEKI